MFVVLDFSEAQLLFSVLDDEFLLPLLQELLEPERIPHLLVIFSSERESFLLGGFVSFFSLLFLLPTLLLFLLLRHGYRVSILQLQNLKILSFNHILFLRLGLLLGFRLDGRTLSFLLFGLGGSVLRLLFLGLFFGLL